MKKGPIIVDDTVLQQAVMKHVNRNAPLYFGLVLQKPKEDGLAHAAQNADDFFKIGSVARVIQVSPFKPGEPLQVLVQALERFDIIALMKKDSIFTADVGLIRLNILMDRKFWNDFRKLTV